MVQRFATNRRAERRLFASLTVENERVVVHVGDWHAGCDSLAPNPVHQVPSGFENPHHKQYINNTLL